MEEPALDEWLEKVVVVVGELGTSGTGGGEKNSWSKGGDKGECMPSRRLLVLVLSPSCVKGRNMDGLGGLWPDARRWRSTGLLLSKDRCRDVTDIRSESKSPLSHEEFERLPGVLSARLPKSSSNPAASWTARSASMRFPRSSYTGQSRGSLGPSQTD